MPATTTTFKSAIAVLFIVGSGLKSAEAHGYISSPQASYSNTYTKTSYSTLISASINPSFIGRKWDGSPEENTQQFTEAFKRAGYSSLRNMLDPVAPGCGNSRVDVPPVNVHDLAPILQFQNDEYHEGFISSHHGPCEVWIDDMKMFHGDDCRAHFTGFPASIPVDFSVCKAPKCILTFYWLALHEPNWQVYKQCVGIQNSANP